MKETVDIASIKIARSLGFNYVPWFNLTILLLAIQSIITCFVLFFRSDFVNLTVCTIAIYMMMNTDKVKKWTFRILVFIVIISLVYDLVWFFL